MEKLAGVTAKEMAIAAGLIGAGFGALHIGNAILGQAAEAGKKILPHTPMIYTAYQVNKTRQAVEGLAEGSKQTNIILEDLVKTIKESNKPVIESKKNNPMPFTTIMHTPYKDGW